VRARLPGAIVEVAHMELAEPSLAAGSSAARARRARSGGVPLLPGPGRTRARHSRGSSSRRAPPIRRCVRVAAPLGFDERLVDVVLARVDAAE
jgi:sirohydrochlorin ferrochelatase